MLVDLIAGLTVLFLTVQTGKRLINGYSFCHFVRQSGFLQANISALIANYTILPLYYGFRMGTNTAKMELVNQHTGETFVWTPVFGHNDPTAS